MPESPRAGALRTVADLMRRHFIALSPQDPLPDAEQKMRMARVRSLPVLSDGHLLGLAQHRDVVNGLMDAARESTSAAARRVGEVMVPPADRVAPGAPLSQAAARLCALQSGFLPVVEPSPDGDRMLGVVTEADLLRAAWQLLRS